MKLDDRQNGTGIVRAGAWLLIAWERLWPPLVPLVLVAIGFFALSWLGVWIHVPQWLHLSILAAFFASALAALLPLRRLLLPTPTEVTRRIEVETHLSDRPISAQVDEIALGQEDDFSRALWLEHRTRMRQRLQDLTSGPPRAKGDRFDPYGLRLMLPILAFIAFMISFGADGGRLTDAFRFGEDPAKLLTRLDVWVNPPAYTRKAPLYLAVDGAHQAGQSLPLPQFSQLIGRFAGKGDLTMWFDDGENQVEILSDKISDDDKNSQKERTYSFELTKSGTVSVISRDNKIAQWAIDVVVDQAPQISFKEEPGASLSGALQLSYSVQDDYGVTQATGIIKPLVGDDDEKVFNRELPARFIPPENARPLNEPLTIKLPLPRQRARSGSAKVNRDISKHPLAGSRVQLTLIARDNPGQEGSSETREMILPGRVFSNPVAMALIEQRRILALDANQRGLVISMLASLTTAPEKFIDDFAVHLALKVAERRLINARKDDELRQVIDMLWEVALGIEFGNMSDVERRLREAQERLSEALENGADDKEIDKLMKELRQAMNELMQALAEQARKNPQSRNPMMQDDAAKILRQRDLERMMDRIENLAKSGSKDAARQLLSEMQRMMDNLRAGRHMQQRQAEGNQMNQALDQLSELMQKQQSLMDETFRMEQGRPNADPSQQGQQQQGQNQQNGEQRDGQNQSGKMTDKEYADALEQLREQQRALQEQLKALNKQLEEMGLQPSGEFDEAGKQMGEAGKQLGKGEAGNAVGNQGQALDALKRGARSVMRQMAGDRQQGGQQQGQGTSMGNRRLTRDPLGREKGDQRSEFGSNRKIPGEIDAQRAREVLNAIRKRLSQPKQRIIEKDYLERLLKNR